MPGIDRWRLFVALVAALAILGAACGGGDDETEGGATQETQPEVEEFGADTTMGQIQEAGKLRVGVKYDVPPFGFENPDSGEVEGFDVDISREVADRLGVDLELTEAITDNRIPFLQDERVDMIASTMTITTDRDAEIDFSTPYFIAHGRILVPGDSDIAGVDDLAGKRVCTALGSTYEATLKEQAPDAKLDLVDSYSECYELIQNGAGDMIIQDDSLKMVGDELTTEPYGLGFTEGETDMQEFADGVLNDLFESGRWTELYDKWVGQYTGTEGQEPPDMTLQEALKLFPCEEFC